MPSCHANESTPPSSKYSTNFQQAITDGEKKDFPKCGDKCDNCIHSAEKICVTEAALDIASLGMFILLVARLKLLKLTSSAKALKG